jgi:arylsulfatase A-like enzyme
VHGSLEDVTPTVLALLGAPVPSTLDGRILDILRGIEADVVTGSPTEARDMADEPVPAGPGRDPATGYTDEEEEAVRRRLEDLGYL